MTWILKVHAAENVAEKEKGKNKTFNKINKNQLKHRSLRTIDGKAINFMGKLGMKIKI